MNRLLTLGLGATLIVALTLPLYAAQPKVPAEPIKMEQTNRPVVFNHVTHTAKDCAVCHENVSHFPPLSISEQDTCVVCHHLIYGELPDVMACSSCHYELDRRDKSTESYFQIAHGRNFSEDDKNSCLNCHMDVIKTRPEKRHELTACAGSACHPKQ